MDLTTIIDQTQIDSKNHLQSNIKTAHEGAQVLSANFGQLLIGNTLESTQVARDQETDGFSCFLAASFFISPIPKPKRPPKKVSAQVTPDVYVGVDMAYGYNAATAKTLIDKVSNFTNFFVVGASGICQAETLGTVFQYAYDNGLSFMSFPPTFRIGPRNQTGYNETEWTSYNYTQWFNYAKTNWTDHLLGFLDPVEDEPGGQMLDQSGDRPVFITNGNISGNVYVDNFQQAANAFVSGYGSKLNVDRANPILNASGCPLWTADYALYWFDYKAGQDGVFAEFGWNYSRQINVALNRGAATAYSKDWGAVLAYTYTVSPYFESGAKLYEDMITAYDAGAKYILIFDTSPNYLTDILQPEHLQAMQQFWQYAQNNPRKITPVWQRTALVLPEGYGYGFRGPDDWIWGLWHPADIPFAHNLNIAVGDLLQQYGDKLDIIYEDSPKPIYTIGYQRIIYWNDPSIQPTPTPTPPPTTTPTTDPTPAPTLDPTPSPTPTPTTTPSPTPTQKSPHPQRQQTRQHPQPTKHSLFRQKPGTQPLPSW